MSSQEISTTVDQQILQAATRLLGEVGEEFTMDQLVARAQVSRATLYRRIGSKEALLQRMARENGLSRDERQDVRSRILAAARRVFGQNGLLNATMEQIADEARVGIATVYRHFGDKDTLVRAFVDTMSPGPALQNLMVRPSADVRADLTRVVSRIVPLYYEYRDILRLVLTGSQAERDYIDRLRAGSDRARDQLIAYFAAQQSAGRLQSSADPQELALAFVGIILGFVVIGPLHYGTSIDNPERISQIIVHTFLDNLLT